MKIFCDDKNEVISAYEDVNDRNVVDVDAEVREALKKRFVELFNEEPTYENSYLSGKTQLNYKIVYLSLMRIVHIGILDKEPHLRTFNYPNPNYWGMHRPSDSPIGKPHPYGDRFEYVIFKH